jgi:hypothetical protein
MLTSLPRRSVGSSTDFPTPITPCCRTQPVLSTANKGDAVLPTHATSHEAGPTSQPGPPTDRSTYRLADEFAFFEFVDQQGLRGVGDDELTPGRYLPAGYVHRWLASHPTGPRGGSRLDLDGERSLEPSVFAGLVRGCWIGSRGDITRLIEMVTQAPSADLTLAVSERVMNRDHVTANGGASSSRSRMPKGQGADS